MAMGFGGKDIYLTPQEAAALLRVSPVTLRHWSLEGRLDFVTTPGGHRRYAREEVERFARDYAQRVPRCEAPPQRRVLLVENNHLVSAYLMVLFEGLDAVVTSEVAHDMFEAGFKLADFQPHTVVLDLATPGLDAPSVCRRIKENPETCHMRVVMIGSSGQENEKRQAMAEGAETCLTKPVEMAQLMAALGLKQAPPA